MDQHNRSSRAWRWVVTAAFVAAAAVCGNAQNSTGAITIRAYVEPSTKVVYHQDGSMTIQMLGSSDQFIAVNKNGRTAVVSANNATELRANGVAVRQVSETSITLASIQRASAQGLAVRQ